MRVIYLPVKLSVLAGERALTRNLFEMQLLNTMSKNNTLGLLPLQGMTHKMVEIFCQGATDFSFGDTALVVFMCSFRATLLLLEKASPFSCLSFLLPLTAGG